MMEIQERYTFSKSERLCHEKKIQRLFHDGKSFLIYPYKVIFRCLDATDEPLQIAISVSKRFSKLAVNRNRVKRLIRETYRLNRNELKKKLIQQGKSIELIFIFVGKKEESFQFMESRMKKVLDQLKEV